MYGQIWFLFQASQECKSAMLQVTLLLALSFLPRWWHLRQSCEEEKRFQSPMVSVFQCKNVWNLLQLKDNLVMTFHKASLWQPCDFSIWGGHVSIFQFREITSSSCQYPTFNLLEALEMMLFNVHLYQCGKLRLLKVAEKHLNRHKERQEQLATWQKTVAVLLCGSSKGIKWTPLIFTTCSFFFLSFLYSPVPSTKPATEMRVTLSHFDNGFWLTLNFSANVLTFVFFDSLARIDKSDQRTGI